MLMFVTQCHSYPIKNSISILDEERKKSEKVHQHNTPNIQCMDLINIYGTLLEMQQAIQHIFHKVYLRLYFMLNTNDLLIF